jgi:N-acetylneuraminic acid mutarotase
MRGFKLSKRINTTLAFACALSLSGCGNFNLVSLSKSNPNNLAAQVFSAAWVNGQNAVNTSGVYGSLGVPSASNNPGSRQNLITWKDTSGNLWLFGGSGYDSAGTNSYLNDLWMFNTSTSQWTWMSGGNIVNQSGIYGTEGTPAAMNVPGARAYATAWTDGSNNLWLFGGNGYDSAGTAARLNDLWKYNIGTGQWTWMSGSNTVRQVGTYGSLGIANPANVPGARYYVESCMDTTSGNLWLFGGFGNDTTMTNGMLNDLWKYNIGTGQWTWMSGSNSVTHAGVYGTQGVNSALNVPGSREYAALFFNSSGNIWLFGGYGLDVNAGTGSLNDLWMFNTTTSQWTWMTGSSVMNASGVYGTQGASSTTTILGAREAAGTWMDSSGNIWVYGGYGYDSAGSSNGLSDLWNYSPTTHQWTWISGSNLANQNGDYGTQGISGTTNNLGGRYSFGTWYDGTYAWIFGGYGNTSTGVAGKLNDLWKITP